MDGKMRCWVTQFEISAFFRQLSELSMPLGFKFLKISRFRIPAVTKFQIPAATKLTQRPAASPKTPQKRPLKQKHETSLNIPVSNNQTECLFEANEIASDGEINCTRAFRKILSFFVRANKSVSASHFKRDIFLENESRLSK